MDVRLIGIPYRLGASSYAYADCWGLVCLYFLDYRGVTLPDYNAWLDGKRVPPRGYVEAETAREAERAWRRIARADVKPGDVVMIFRLRPFDHCAVVSDNPRELLTTDASRGSHLVAWEDAGRVEGVYRYAGA